MNLLGDLKIKIKMPYGAPEEGPDSEAYPEAGPWSKLTISRFDGDVATPRAAPR